MGSTSSALDKAQTYYEHDAAARALFNAWHELWMLSLGTTVTAWPVVLDAIEDQLTRESVLLALPPAARAHVELLADVKRCRCSARLLADDERLRGLCTDCAADLLLEADDHGHDE